MKLRNFGLVLCALALHSCTKNAVTIEPDDTGATDKTQTGTSAACYSNPVVANPSGDPYCFKYNGKFYMYRPESSNNSVIYNTSTDMISWSATGTITLPSGTGAVWAPEVHEINGSLYLIFADPSGTNGGRDIRVCKMSSPTSVGSNSPVTLVGNGDINIDPSVYQDGSNYYLVWKNKSTGGSKIKIRQLKATDPTQFAAGSSSTVIIPDATGWPTNKEHPFLISQDYGSGQTRYFLFYNSGMGDTPDYRVNYATASSLTGPYTNKGVLIEKNASRNIYSVGGHSIVRDGDNYRWIVYRAKNTSDDGWDGRKPCIDRLFVDATANTATSEATRTQSAYCPAPLP